MRSRRQKYSEPFFALLRAGLWERSVRLPASGNVDFSAMLKLAEEQSVVGLVAARLEGVDIPKSQSLLFLRRVLSLEGRNQEMNKYIASLSGRLAEAGVRAVLVKGQGIARCYERPLWRAAGDIDLLLDRENYAKAKELLAPLASALEKESKVKRHLGMNIDGWILELHGAMYTDLSGRIDRGIDELMSDVFGNGGTRIWDDGGVEVILPSPDNDAVLVFTHFVQHFFVGGVGLRQICDWCRLLWVYRESIDRELLAGRLRSMGLTRVWEAFAAFAVEYLGMPVESMPLYRSSRTSRRRSARICRVVLDAGNFGHNKDNSYRSKYPRLVGNIITFFRRLGEYFRLLTIFPLDAPRFFVTYVFRRLRAAM